MDSENTPPDDKLSTEEWSALMHLLAKQAEHSLRWMRKGTASTDDTVMSTLRTYLRQANQGELPPPTDPDSLWPVLEKQLERKIDAAKATQGYKKNRMAVRYSELAPSADGLAAENAFVSQSTSPEQVEAYVDQAMQLLTETIEEEELLRIAQMKLECYSVEEIAETTGLSDHQVRRRLARIKAVLRTPEATDG